MMMLVALGHALSCRDLARGFKKSKISITVEACKKRYKNKHKENYVEDMFVRCVRLVVDDIVDNNARFHLPLASPKKDATIGIDILQGKRLETLRKHKGMPGLDFLASDFKGYKLVFKYPKLGVTFRTPVHITGDQARRLLENTNNGKQYF